jgi:hypothetical protein
VGVQVKVIEHEKAVQNPGLEFLWRRTGDGRRYGIGDGAIILSGGLRAFAVRYCRR